MVHYIGNLDLSRTPKAEALEFGARLKQLRLNKDIKQEDVADGTGLERRIIMKAEQGNVTLINLIAILQFYGAMQSLDAFLPKQPLSPIQLVKLQGNKRTRASAKTADTSRAPNEQLIETKSNQEDLGW